MIRKPIEGFARYYTDGVGVYLPRTNTLLRPVGDVYHLIPDVGDGINTVAISVTEALNAGTKHATAPQGDTSRPATARKRSSKKSATKSPNLEEAERES